MDNLTLDFIPDYPLLSILSYLNYEDLINCCFTCRRLQALANHNPLWRRQCRVYWLIKTCPENQTWRNCFVYWFRRYGKYIKIYRTIRQAWDQIEMFLKRFCPVILQSFEEGLSEGDIDTMETHLKQSLPLDLRCSYRLCGGQNLNVISAPPGLLGSIFYGGTSFTEHLLQPGCMLLVQGERYIALSHCSSVQQFQVLALNDRIGFIPGQVFYVMENDIHEGGTQSTIISEFISANSYTEWLTTYAQQLADEVFPVVEQNIFRFPQDPKVVTKTGNIKVSVATAFLTSFSCIDPPHFMHAYRITMSMSEDALESESCQLTSRHWTITDEDGAEEKVSGPGVVGEFPIMRPGASFTWISSTYFHTTYGSMRGHFVMRNLQTGAEFNVSCPTFNMKCLPYQTPADRRERVLRSKKNR